MKQRSEELDQWLEEESREDPLRDDEDPELATEGLEVIFDANDAEMDLHREGKRKRDEKLFGLLYDSRKTMYSAWYTRTKMMDRNPT
tara:strand:+ start:255 stop:515 length:261 start_codon:yes stop_codon:yes gene_type:complete